MSKCKEIGCDRYASYGLPDGPKIKCAEHKTPDLVQKKKKQCCKYDGCPNTAIFGNRDGVKKYCSEHKKENMINLNHKLCKVEGCERYALYGEDDKKEYCGEHKNKNMTNLDKKNVNIIIVQKQLYIQKQAILPNIVQIIRQMI